jgi:hypothetical protein
MEDLKKDCQSRFHYNVCRKYCVIYVFCWFFQNMNLMHGVVECMGLLLNILGMLLLNVWGCYGAVVFLDVINEDIVVF